MSFNSIRGQGLTRLPLHPHLLSVFFSRWCNSAVRCRGHHKLTRSLIMMDLMSGKERGREWGATRETLRKTETESSSSYLPGDMAERIRGGTNSSRERRHHHHHKRWSEGRSKCEQQKEREKKGAMPGYDITGVVLSVLFQMETVSWSWGLAKETLTGLPGTVCVCMCVCMRDGSKVSEKDTVNVFSLRAKMPLQVSQEDGRKPATVS